MAEEAEMIVSSPTTLKRFRGPGRCEYCLKQCQHREAAHIFACGRDNGNRMDMNLNLISLGLGGWCFVKAECVCHQDHHAGREPTRKQLLALAAKREGVSYDDAETVIYLIARLPKDPSPRDVFTELDCLSGSTLELAVRVLREIRLHLPRHTREEIEARFLEAA